MKLAVTMLLSLSKLKYRERIFFIGITDQDWFDASSVHRGLKSCLPTVSMARHFSVRTTKNFTLVISQAEYRIREPASETLIVGKLFKQFRIILQ